MKARWKLWGMLPVIFSLALAACSGGGGPSSTGGADHNGQTQNNDANEGEKKEAGQKHKITMMTVTYGDPPPKNSKAIEMINEKFNVDFEVTVVPYSNYQEKLATTMAGTMPDIVVVEEYLAGSNLYKWADQGAFLPLNDYIEQYPTFKLVSNDIWAQLSVDDQIFGIPKYYPQLNEFDFIIRKDWLDNLNLPVPTSYEELKEVAIAFTNDDPDQNGKADTYGLAMGEYGYPHYSGNGVYWDANAWYHKDEQGKLIPGIIGPGRKAYVQTIRELVEAGAVTRDFGAVKDFADVQKEFYSGKAGIFIGGMRGLNYKNAEALLEIHPEAQFIGIPPFKAPDGSQGKTIQKGFYMLTVLNGKLKNDPDKVDRILQMIDYGRHFYPKDQWTPENEHLDWLWGGHNEGYTVAETGVIQLQPPDTGKVPAHYMPDTSAWAPNVLANEYAKSQLNERYAEYVSDLENIFKSYKGYVNPVHLAKSEALMAKSDELNQWALNEQVKMMMGRTPLSDWDQMVQQYMERGGSQIIQEVNDSLQDRDLSNLWKAME